VERLALSHQPVITVTAPAGYGKTTVLSQWAERVGPRVAWLSLDEADSDPAVLLAYLALALHRLEPVEPRSFRSLGAPGDGMADVLRLVSSLDAMTRPVHLVLDHAEALASAESRDVIAEVAMRMPAGTRLAIASRHEVPLPVARLRAHGTILEIGASDLTMGPIEAGSLMARAGVDLPETETDALVTRTEGWPAGLYLAALAINAGSSRIDIGRTLTGDDRYIGDYLRSEFLGRVSRADVTFLTRTSVLDRLSGPLCDATVGRTGSSAVLTRLERRNLLVVPLDRRGEWYRYHHLFRELLHTELLRREPETARELHVRAAAWYEANEQPEAAIGHAQHAQDAERVERLVLTMANSVWAGGRQDTVLRWMEWFSSHQLLDRHPAIALHGALMYALAGRPAEAEQWAGAAERGPAIGRLSDGNTLEGSIAYLHALLCRRGMEEMRRDADAALAGLSPTSPYRPAMMHVAGVADLLDGDLDGAQVLFTRALDEATAAGLIPSIPLLCAELGIVAITRGDWTQAGSCADHASSLMKTNDLDDYWTSALVYAWLGRVEAHRGEVAIGRDHLVRAARLRPLLTYALPIVSGQALLEMARAYLALADPAGAVAALRQMGDIQQHRRDLGGLAAVADELRAHVDRLKGEMLGASSLTTAELRLLPLLATHLSLAEISERLLVSRNTVKTQAISVYRKLGVSTRSETIERMQQIGLVAQS
jgi:LuxR family maltose regulon positive regulatory protein